MQFLELIPASGRALVALDREGGRRTYDFAEIHAGAADWAAALAAAGVRRGDVVVTLVGNRPEWVLAMCTCYRQGYVALPCNEQLRTGR